MDSVTASVLMVLAGLGVRVVALAFEETRARWQDRQEQVRRRELALLARSLPRGSRLDEVREDGSEVHLVISRYGGSKEGGSA
ncbi:hypothetical protein ACIRVK_35190 [Streptomyces sp. NPDC101152]|uniref:hypothetical protein n=1 Tax=Streptomyces sp. NPDC101152 TaxID=3366116 RepID=UPI0038061E38